MALRPTDPTTRIAALDTLRGIALCGILLINIVGMAGPIAMDRPIGPPALIDPNWQVWAVGQVFVHGTMRGLFSLLFGVGLAIFLDRPDEAGLRERLHARRLTLLFLFGVLDATVLLWPGDILTTYALAGLLVTAMRGLSRHRMAIAAFVLLAMVALWQMTDAALMPAGADVYTAAMVARERAARLGGYTDTLAYMSMVSLAWTASFGSLRWVGDAAAFMLIGVIAHRSRLFDADVHVAARLAGWGYATGLPIRLWMTISVWRAGGAPVAIADLLDQVGRLAMTLGHLGLFLLLWRAAGFRRLSRPLAYMGRMALTLYLAQSLIGATIFSGFGLGLWGRVSGWWLWGIAAAIWAVEACFALLWFRTFGYGPVEWLWRWGTYGERPKR